MKATEKSKQDHALKPGQKVFELDTITGNIASAKYKKLNSIHSILIERKDCIYIPANNINHAIKKIHFLLGKDRGLTEMLNNLYAVIFPYWEPFEKNDYIGPYLHNHQIAFDEQIKYHFINPVSKLFYVR